MTYKAGPEPARLKHANWRRKTKQSWTKPLPGPRMRCCPEERPTPPRPYLRACAMLFRATAASPRPARPCWGWVAAKRHAQRSWGCREQSRYALPGSRTCATFSLYPLPLRRCSTAWQRMLSSSSPRRIDVSASDPSRSTAEVPRLLVPVGAVPMAPEVEAAALALLVPAACLLRLFLPMLSLHVSAKGW